MSVRKQKTSKGKTEFYHYRFMLDGEWKCGVCEGCRTKKEAEQFESEVRQTLNDLKKQKNVKALVENYREVLTGGGKVLLAEAYDLSLKKPRRKIAGAKQIEHKRSYWRDFLAFMNVNYPEVKLLSEILKRHAEEYIQYLRTNGRFEKTILQKGKKSYECKFSSLSSRTLNVMLESVSEVINVLSDDAGVFENPFSKVEKLEEISESRNAFSEDELKKKKEKSQEGNLFVFALFAIACLTGMREGDVCTLKWVEADLEHGYIYRKVLKTGKLIEVPIVPPLHNFLLEQKVKTGNGEYVLPEHAQMYLNSPDGISWRVKGFLEDVCEINTTKKVKGRTRIASIKDVHSCRHTFAYLAGVHGIPLVIVQSVLGHMSPEMTSQYQAHANRADKTKAMARMSVSFLGNVVAPLLPGGTDPSIDVEAAGRSDSEKIKVAIAYISSAETLDKAKLLAILS